MNCFNCNASNLGKDAAFPENSGTFPMAMTCPDCNTREHRLGARFCRHCGSQLTMLACPVCNATEHRQDARFCRHCGSSLETSATDGINGNIGEEESNDDLLPVSDTPESVTAVDLGLPSGTKWASCNVGAEHPEEYGYYYAWGETNEKDEYSWENYEHGDEHFFHDIGEDICGTEHDAARVKWGGDWQLPSNEQIRELINNCDCEWTSLNGIKGSRFTGPNGNSIFLPAGGYFDGANQVSVRECGYYWSGTLNPYDSEDAFYFEADEDGADHYGCSRKDGQMIRPVTTQ